ncbi:MAG: hypothetical protein HZY79_00070 [Rhodoblastus sp.]|nr:MAG: hypothetical protein HZY79_00070 [Rhodoblastus sp.]
MVALAILARDLVAWAGGPLWRWIARLRLLALLSAWVATLPRWAVLLTLAAPIAISEPLKLGGLYLLAIGQLKLGAALQIVGHGLSILLVERIVHAGLPQLLTYRWFAWGWGWIEAIRAAVGEWPLVVAARAGARRLAEQARRAARDMRLWVAHFVRR